MFRMDFPKPGNWQVDPWGALKLSSPWLKHLKHPTQATTSRPPLLMAVAATVIVQPSLLQVNQAWTFGQDVVWTHQWGYRKGRFQGIHWSKQNWMTWIFAVSSTHKQKPTWKEEELLLQHHHQKPLCCTNMSQNLRFFFFGMISTFL